MKATARRGRKRGQQLSSLSSALGTCVCHGGRCFSMALSMISSFGMHAMSTTFLAFPAARMERKGDRLLKFGGSLPASCVF